MRTTLLALGAAFVFALAGCSEIPVGGDPVVAASSEHGSLGRLAIAPIVTMTLAESEVSKHWSPGEVFIRDEDPESFRRAIKQGIAATGAFASPLRDASSQDLLEAWEGHDDYVLSVAIENIRISFELNGWYYWNIANFVFNVWPAWLVAKEDYTLAFDASVTVRSGDSGNALVENKVIPVSVKGSFDEFDRGFQFFGCLSVTLEAENWRLVVSKLLPAARRQLAEKLAVEMDAPLRGVVAQKSDLQRKRLLVAVGVTHYADATRFPRLEYGAEDAAAVTSAFRSDGLLLPQHAITLSDDRATRAGVSAAIGTLFGRANDGDASVFYFAGYGTRTPNGEPAIAFYDASAQADVVPLGSLADEIARGKGQKLMILDCSFDQGRAVRGGPAPQGEELAKYARPGLRILAACGPSETAVAPLYLKGGVFTYELLQGLSGRADENHDGRVTLDELFTYARERVTSEVSYRGDSQCPRQAGAGEIVFELRRAPLQ